MKAKRHAEAEKDFPRGGATGLTPLEYREAQRQAEQDFLFEVKQDSSASTDQPSRKRVRSNSSNASTASAATSQATSTSRSSFISVLRFKTLVPGLVLLGAVADIHDFDITVSLPNNLFGHVSITSISDVLSAQVERAASEDHEGDSKKGANDDDSVGDESDNDNGDDNDDSGANTGMLGSRTEDRKLPDLRTLFTVGQLIQCAVIKAESGPSHKKVDLSLNPSVVNAGLSRTDLQPGMVISVAVKSREDHGYAVDLGIDDVSGFLPTTKTDGAELVVGQVLTATVQTVSAEGRAVTVAASVVGMTSLAKTNTETMTLDVIRAGQLGQARVTAASAKGLALSFMSTFEASVEAQHIDADGSGKSFEERYPVGSKVRTRVLFVDMNNRHVSVSLKSHLVNWRPVFFPSHVEQEEGDIPFEVGTILDNTTVTTVDPGTALFLRHSSLAHPLYASILRVSDTPLEKFTKMHRVDTTHRCRVIGLNFLDGYVLVSMQESVLNKPFLSISNIRAGTTVEGHVMRCGPFGVVVQLMDTIRGLIPLRNVADVPLRNVAKKFPDGAKVTCMVLTVDAARKKVILTSQRSFLQSDLPKITIKGDARKDLISLGYIAAVKPFGLFVRFFNDMRAIVYKKDINDLLAENLDKSFHVGQAVKVKIVRFDGKHGRFIASAKINEQPLQNGQKQNVKEAKPKTSSASLGSADDQIKSLDDLAVGRKIKVLVKKIMDDHVIVQITSAIQGRLHATNVVDKVSDLAKPTAPFAQIKVGDNINVKILGFSKRKNVMQTLAITHRESLASMIVNVSTKPSDLALPDDHPSPTLTDSFPKGYKTMAIVKATSKKGVVVTLGPGLHGYVENVDISPSLEIAQNPGAFFEPRQLVYGILLSSADRNKPIKHINMPKFYMRLLSSSDDPFQHIPGPIGSLVTGRISEINVSEGLKLTLSHHGNHLFGRVGLTELSDTYKKLATKPFKLGALVQAVVTSTDAVKQHDLSLRSSLVELAKSDEVSHMMAKKPAQVKNVFARATLPNPMKRTSALASFGQAQEGMIVAGYVKSASEKGVFVAVGPKVSARVKIADLSDKFVKDWKTSFPPGKLVRGKITSVNHEKQFIDMTLKHSAVRHTPGTGTSMVNWGNLEVGMKLTGKIKRIESFGVFVSFDNSKLSGLCHRSELADEPVKDISQYYSVNDPVRFLVLSVNKDAKQMSLGLKASYFEDDTDGDSLSVIQEEEDDEEDEEDDQETPGDDDDLMEANDVEEFEPDMFADEDEEDVELDEDEAEKEEKMMVKKPSFGTPSLLNVRPGFQWDDGLSTEKTPKKEDLSGSSEDDEDSEDEDAMDVTGAAKTKKKSKREKRRQRDEAEARIAAQEEALLQADVVPQTAEDYDRLLLADPNNSLLWIKYMAFQLGLTELAKARAVAERALNTINFREEQEKLNIWVALMNLENSYGTQESLMKVFERAVAHNNPKKVYMHFVRIYERTEKFDAAEGLYTVMIKKFRESSKVWIQYCMFKLHVRKDADGARKLLDRSLKSLPKHKHIKTISKFAQMEFKFGEAERGRTIFEGIMNVYPKRADLWSIYVDMENRTGDVAATRRLLERIVHLKWSSKKMKFFLKRYLDFEKRNGGGQTQIEHVKDLARAYIESSGK